MPIYSYKCAVCNTTKDVIVSYKDRSDAIIAHCKGCNQTRNFHYQLSAPTPVFKGKGWAGEEIKKERR